MGSRVDAGLRRAGLLRYRQRVGETKAIAPDRRSVPDRHHCLVLLDGVRAQSSTSSMGLIFDHSRCRNPLHLEQEDVEAPPKGKNGRPIVGEALRRLAECSRSDAGPYENDGQANRRRVAGIG